MKTIEFYGYYIQQDLYYLITNYANFPGFEENPCKETLRKFIDSGIYNSKQVIQELYDETREYPPLLYYIILSFLQIKHPYTKSWRLMTKEERNETLKEFYEWLEELKHNIKDEKDNLLF